MSNKYFTFLLFLLIILTCSQNVVSLIPEKQLEDVIALKNDIQVDLHNPIYTNGLITTQEGGVVTSASMRIQARHIQYYFQKAETPLKWTIEAEEDVFVNFGNYTFIGKKLIYDFQSKEGIIFDGKTVSGPWFFGGKELYIHADGNYTIFNGYLTTSERDYPQWGIYSDSVFVENEQFIHATNIELRFLNMRLLWLPSWRTNLNSIFNSPLRYRFRWGGHQGPRFGLTYEIFSWKKWKTFLRFDYRLTRGPGGGIETYYSDPDNQTEFRNISYLAKDSSLLHIHEKFRYRFEGVLQKTFANKKTRLLLTYDKISDKDMPNCYYDQDFFIETADRTQLLVRHQEDNWIGNAYCRVKVNNFQTVKQELPTFSLHLKPFNMRKTGILFENKASVSYLDFNYSDHLSGVHNYNSTRFNQQTTFYRPFNYKQLTYTPEAGLIQVLYGDSPSHDPQAILVGKFGLDLKTSFYRYYTRLKHVVEPYIFYRYYSKPLSSPKEHYIFDISDGLTQLNYVCFGLSQSFYNFSEKALILRPFSANLYTYAFFDTHKIKQTFPRVYADVSWSPLATLKQSVYLAWNIDFQELDYIHFRSEWTMNTDFAIAAEYRYRGPYSWRKVDPQNFFLDMYHSEKRLRHSSVSDQRQTFILNLFYRFHPNWATELSLRKGWNRRTEPNYLEYEIDFLTTIQTAWNLRLSFQHQQNDNRAAVYMTVGLNPPSFKMKNKTLTYYD